MTSTVVDRLIQHEAVRLKAYDDATGKELKPGDTLVGQLTIGVGRNLSSRGLSNGEVMSMLNNDLSAARADLDRNAPWWRDLDATRGGVLLELCFAMGWPKLAGFTRMLTAIQLYQFEEAAAELLDSKWADDTDGKHDGKASMRAALLAGLLRVGGP